MHRPPSQSILTRLPSPVPSQTADLLSALHRVSESIAQALLDPDLPANYAYLTGVATELVQPVLLYHTSMEVRRLIAGCLSGILLRPEVKPRCCRVCSQNFPSFAAVSAHESSCDGGRSRASTALTSPPTTALPVLSLLPQPAAAAAAPPEKPTLKTSGRVALTSSGSRPRALSIHYAAREGNLESIRWFLQNGTKVRISWRGFLRFS